jgi:hypothetical protein
MSATMRHTLQAEHLAGQPVRTGEHATSYLLPVVGVVESPGAGPVPGEATVEQAAANAEMFAADLRGLSGYGVSVAPLTDPSDDEAALLMGGTSYQPDHDGRFPFRLTVKGTVHVLEMPGLPLPQVRYLGADNQNIRDFPRVFLDGSSWAWAFGLRVLGASPHHV